jgi:prepilin-type N-terminal cleavage/methylation domain-containing protein/prepilin-type processing-associated H-X9-DG protein
MTYPRSRRAGFTLVELLVVIGIIALLIAILLPSLQKARRAANSIACAANIRSILQAMHIYAAQNNGSIPGSAWTTSQFMFNDVAKASQKTQYATNLPFLFDAWDFHAPLLKIMGIKFEEGQSNAQRSARFDFMRNHKAFRCPENSILSYPYPPSAGWKTDTMVSYNTALLFLVQRPRDPSGTGTNGFSTPPVSNIGLPASYNVKLSKVGGAAGKIYVADGGRFVDPTSGPDYDTATFGSYGGAFADQGAWSAYSRSWARGAGNAATRSAFTRDLRIFAYRHGTQKQFATASDSYKANFGFFDGHVDLLGDMQSANPAYWMPKGTIVTGITPGGGEMLKDAYDVYVKTGDTYNVP